MDISVTNALFSLVGIIIAAIVSAIWIMWQAAQRANDKLVEAAQKDAERSRLEKEKVEKERDTFRELLKDAVKVLPIAVNSSLEKQGLPPMPLIADVVPISNSLVTPEQERNAEVHTALAATAAAKLSLGMAPRIAEKMAAKVSIEPTIHEVTAGEKSSKNDNQ